MLYLVVLDLKETETHYALELGGMTAVTCLKEAKLLFKIN